MEGQKKRQKRNRKRAIAMQHKRATLCRKCRGAAASFGFTASGDPKKDAPTDFRLDPGPLPPEADGLSDYEEIYLTRTSPLLADTDGTLDGRDPHPWLKDSEWVAKLDNRYTGIDYLKIRLLPDSNDPCLTDLSYPFADGGNQSWWKDKAYEEWEFAPYDSDYSKYYRLQHIGCGVIAMCDMELYLTQQNPGYRSVYGTPAYDGATGIIQKADYRRYVERGYVISYWIPNTLEACIIGLMPSDMVGGMDWFLKANGSEFYSVKWAPYFLLRKQDQKKMVLDEIESMLGNNIPVVFSCAHLTKKIILYSSLEIQPALRICIGSGKLGEKVLHQI